VKVAIAGKGGVGKTTIAALLVRELARKGLRVLAVDCDPNPNLAESFALDSARLDRFMFADLRPVVGSLELVRAPTLAEIEANRIWLLGGPPSAEGLNDAVARGIAGVLVAHRFDWVVTDLGAGPEFTFAAVGGVLNPADVCVVLTDGGPVADLTADRIEAACRARNVPSLRAVNDRGCLVAVAGELLTALHGIETDV
jgi:CO dehydrogenase nickel-insertion accessory protein CooC1